MISGKDNSGHTAILRSAKISLQETSYVRKTLGIKGGIHGDSNNLAFFWYHQRSGCFH